MSVNFFMLFFPPFAKSVSLKKRKNKVMSNCSFFFFFLSPVETGIREREAEGSSVYNEADGKGE